MCEISLQKGAIVGFFLIAVAVILFYLVLWWPDQFHLSPESPAAILFVFLSVFGAIFLLVCGLFLTIPRIIEHFKWSITIKKRLLIEFLSIALGAFILGYLTPEGPPWSGGEFLFLMFLGGIFLGLGVGDAWIFLMGAMTESIEIKLKPAKPDELFREDEVLMDTTAFLQGMIFIYLSLVELPISFFENYVFYISVPVSGIVFFILRAVARIRNDNNMRFRSIYFLVWMFLIDYGLFISILLSIPEMLSIVSAILAFLGLHFIGWASLSFAYGMKTRYRV